MPPKAKTYQSKAKSFQTTFCIGLLLSFGGALGCGEEAPDLTSLSSTAMQGHQNIALDITPPAAGACFGMVRLPVPECLQNEYTLSGLFDADLLNGPINAEDDFGLLGCSKDGEEGLSENRENIFDRVNKAEESIEDRLDELCEGIPGYKLCSWYQDAENIFKGKAPLFEGPLGSGGTWKAFLCIDRPFPQPANSAEPPPYPGAPIEYPNTDSNPAPPQNIDVGIWWEATF